MYINIKKNIFIYGKNKFNSDRTSMRDFIDIRDLCTGHLKSIKKLNQKNYYEVFNLGSGKPKSVIEITKIFSRKGGRKINFIFKQQRKGDIKFSLSNISKAKSKLKWKPVFNVSSSCLN